MSNVTEIPFSVSLNADQQAAMALAWNPLTVFHLFYGGGGSGKSFFIMMNIWLRAMMAPGSRHICFRLTSVSCRQTLFDKTLKEFLDAAYPGQYQQLLASGAINQTEMSVTLPNESVIFFNGLQDDGRMQKVLGDEYQTIWLNECNEFSYKQVSTLIGRLRGSKVRENDGKSLKKKMFFDCNPDSKKDWEYLAFREHVNPIDKNALPKPQEWVSIMMRPQANIEHLGEDYIENMASGMTAAERLRYIDGLWSSDRTGAVFSEQHINDNRIALPNHVITPDEILAYIEKVTGQTIVRTVVGVDPNASDNPNSDLTGINVACKTAEGHCFILADKSRRGRPEEWAKTVSDLYTKWHVDRVVAEKNNGGLMVETTLRGAYRHLPIRLVHASKGKTSRAEPVSALYERGLIHHVGRLDDLELEMVEWGTPSAKKSPDRMDALVWAVWELMDLGNKGPQPVKTRVAQRLR